MLLINIIKPQSNIFQEVKNFQVQKIILTAI